MDRRSEIEGHSTIHVYSCIAVAQVALMLDYQFISENQHPSCSRDIQKLHDKWCLDEAIVVIPSVYNAQPEEIFTLPGGQDIVKRPMEYRSNEHAYLT